MNQSNIPAGISDADIDAQFGDEPVKKEKELQCEYGHMCTSGCQKDFDCPCQNTHCCSMSSETCGDTENCEFCASRAPDHADLVNDNLNER